ncbi:putative RNA-binding protein [Lasiodiplodia theobromae]|uniref:U4/U6 snRNA-associated-splicing factor PRP24 n=1 Tax=Lasiodiplodia theobromae TaxID=45133 RepID=A0A5N5CY98_9PEZI|nr:putative RNA-binding protein [Lasiodiplodia theobromae]
MNIANLLSPQDSPAKEESQTPPLRSPQPSQSPLQRPGRPAKSRKSSGLSQVQQYSPPPQLPPQQHPHQHQQQHPQQHQQLQHHHQQLQQHQHHQPTPPQHIQLPQLPTPGSSHSYLQYQNVQHAPSPGSSSAHNGRGMLSATSTPTGDIRSPLAHIQEARTPPASQRPQQPQMHRHGSTPGMDTLADLASMQHHQQATRQSSQGLRSPQVFQRAPSVGYNVHNITRTMSSTSAKDITMHEQPRVLHAASLGAAENKEINELLAKLKENSYDYTSHIRLVELLTNGLRDHVHPPDQPGVSRDPFSYELLSELRRARHTMHAKFAIGEESWVAWITDEKTLARSTEDRLSLMELCLKSVQEEPSSSTLWRLYGDYMYWLWAAAFDVEPADWTEDDKNVGREVFSWQAMKDVWEQALPATQWHINDSHLVWDRWMEIMLRDQEARPETQKLHHLRNAFTDRLLKPHATWENTFQMYSTFISRYFNAEYEDTMMTMTKRASRCKEQFALREHHELKVERAVKDGDKNAEWEAYSAYLEWELRNKGVFSFHLINALFERATLRFSIDATIWLNYVELLMEHPDSGVEVLPVLERATRHCPWSGELWSHRLLTLEAEGRSFDEMESVKHSATETGLLDVGGLEELLKVYIAWCGFLRRKAFDARSSEDDVDIAEVGIRSALEHVKEIGEKRYGKEFQGDPAYRLERINIKFITQSGNIQSARDCWRALVPRLENSYDFWFRYYTWEMVVWSKWCTRDKDNAGQQLESPREATNLLRQALKKVTTMDWPEALIDMFINHCEQNETVHEYRYAVFEAKKARAEVATRRQREAVEAAAAYQQQAVASTEAPYEDPAGNGKRKRDYEAAGEEIAAKKSRQAEEASVEPMELEPSSSTTAQLKRDREHTTVIVKNIPSSASQTRVRQFFNGCGKINSIILVPDDNGSTQSATVEFETQEDAKFAVSRDGKALEGESVQISLGTGSTLYVTNYPPEYDEANIRKLFKEHGEVVSVRFPSLKYNTHRRFCYVTFASAQQAEAASAALNNKSLGRNLKLKAVISDPAHKQVRQGALYDGREIFIGNIEHGATDQQVQDLLSPLEGFVNVRVPRNFGGKMKGVAFAEFDTPDNAKKAVETLDAKEFLQRILRATISEPKGTKRHATTIISQPSASPEPTGETTTAATDMNGTTASSSDAAKDRRERTIALLNIPDTVNDARIRSLVEPHGTLKKIILMPEHQGAIVEFAHVADVGKASLALDGAVIDESSGRKISVGTVEEMKKMRAEKKVDRIGAGGAKKKDDKKKEGESSSTKSTSAFMQPAPRISRPGAPGAGAGRRGGKGGLGIKRATGPSASAAGKDVEMGDANAGASGAGGKSNADFKAMFLASREKGKGEGGDEKKDGDGGDGGGGAGAAEA